MPRRLLHFLLLLAIAVAAAPSGAGASGFPISGVVTDLDGAPIEGARAYLARYLSDDELAARGFDRRGPESIEHRATSDADGVYLLEAPRPGLYRVVLTAGGFRPVERDTGAVTAPVELPAAGLRRLKTSAMVMVDSDGSALADKLMLVTPNPEQGHLWDDGWEPYNAPTRSDDEGKVRLTLSEGEEPLLWLERSGGAPIWIAFQTEEPQVGNHLGRAVTVRAVDGAGDPVAGALIRGGCRPVAFPSGKRSRSAPRRCARARA
ncbi:MAG: carboxypeptidase-like regulatory domain-containing protein, partial [Acidobacteriota bacterium]